MRRLFALAALVAAFVVAPAPTAGATSCVTIVGARFNAPGADGVMPGLNGEWIRVRNACSTGRSLSGYRVHDLGSAHVYRFPEAFRLAAGATVRLHSGTGTNTASDLYWGRTSGQVWNNRPPEWAYLLDPSGVKVSEWSWPLAPVVSHGSRTQARIALTIDDGYNTSICRQLLTILEREKVAATWLPVSTAVTASPAFWREVVAAGFPLADHTVNHPHLTTLSIGAQYDEMVDARTAVERTLGIRVLPIVRPPYGEYENKTRRAATAGGFADVLTWDTTFADTSPTATLQRQISYALRAQNGSVVLMHCNARTPAILQAVIPEYRERGFTFVTLGQMFGLGGSVPSFD